MSVSTSLSGWRLKVANAIVLAAFVAGAVRALFRL